MKTQNNNQNKINKVLGLCLFFIFSAAMYAQDIITFKNGDEINAKVLEINPAEIKYKQFDNPEGPTRIVARGQVFSIKYQNGNKDVFNEINTNQQLYSNYELVKVAPTVIDKTNFIPAPRQKFNGPRLGLTFISSGTSADYLTGMGKSPVVSQFGWQFETRIFTIENGTSGIVEFVPMIAGMEQGLFLPSGNLLIGLRSGGKRAFEFALGPNVSFAGLGMVIAAGTNFRSGKINFPVNIAVVPSIGSYKNIHDPNTNLTTKTYVESGWRLTLTVGFNSRIK